jgi:hypothetical protein
MPGDDEPMADGRATIGVKVKLAMRLQGLGL